MTKKQLRKEEKKKAKEEDRRVGHVTRQPCTSTRSPWDWRSLWASTSGWGVGDDLPITDA